MCLPNLYLVLAAFAQKKNRASYGHMYYAIANTQSLKCAGTRLHAVEYPYGCAIVITTIKAHMSLLVDSNPVKGTR
jgi:hypothetical protein